jgi:hypothetical protein
LVAALVAFMLCGCVLLTFAAALQTGLSQRARTERLVASAPSDGSIAVKTLRVLNGTDSLGNKAVLMAEPDDSFTMYTVRLQPGYSYRIDGHPSNLSEFFAASRQGGQMTCELRYTRGGIASLSLTR